MSQAVELREIHADDAALGKVTFGSPKLGGSGRRPSAEAPAHDERAWSRRGIEPYVESYHQFEESLGEERLSSIHRRRRNAFEVFRERGFPTTKHEEWRNTSVVPVARTPFQWNQRSTPLSPEQRAGLVRDLLGSPDAPVVLLVNGQMETRSSAHPFGGVVQSLAERLSRDPQSLEAYLGQVADFEEAPFVALNTAFLHDGVVIEVPAGRTVAEPVVLLYVSSAEEAPTVSYPRTLVVAGPHSQVTVVEAYASVGDGVTFTNAVTEFVVGEGAVVDHYRAQQDNDRSFHISTQQARLSRSSTLSSHSLSFGGGLVRNDVKALLGGEGGECTLNGLYLVNGRQLVDNHTAIDHAAAHCSSHEVYHGVLDGEGAGVFNGRILVRPDAQKTDAKQTNRTLLLSNDAIIDTKPQLEIFADDVRCTHGATVGHLDETALFYLRARGIPREEAAALLTFAFANEIIERVKVEPFREQMERQIFGWLSQAHVREAV